MYIDVEVVIGVAALLGAVNCYYRRALCSLSVVPAAGEAG